jgi:hypothetical protein
MEISPITGIRSLPVAKEVPIDPRLPAVMDVTNSERAGDDAYSGSGQQAAGGEDDEAQELEVSAEVESTPQQPEDTPPKKINYFA